MNWKKKAVSVLRMRISELPRRLQGATKIYIFFLQASGFFIECWATCNKWREPYAGRLARTVLRGVLAERPAPTRLEAQKN